MLVEKITEALDQGESVVCVFLDFSKAFDTVDHNILLTKNWWICNIELKWFENYLSDRMQYVTYNNHKSSHEKKSLWSTTGIYIGSHIVFTRGQSWPSGIVVACVCVCVCVCLSVCQSLACPRDNSVPVQARIAKFGPKMQKTLVKVPIVFGAIDLWPSRSNLTSKSEFTQFWACPDHYSLPIQARITKFGPEVENSLVKVPIVLGGNWPRPSRSNLI